MRARDRQAEVNRPLVPAQRGSRFYRRLLGSLSALVTSGFHHAQEHYVQTKSRSPE